MKSEKIIKDGIFVQEKIIKYQKCAECNAHLFLQIYMYDKKPRKVVRCKKCNTYSVLEEKKKYPTDI